MFMKPLNPDSLGIGSIAKAALPQTLNTQTKKIFPISDIVFIASLPLTVEVILCAETKLA